MVTKRLCYSCDLKNNPKLIEANRAHHADGNIWPEITKSIKDAAL